MEKKKTERNMPKKEEKVVEGTFCNDVNCAIHGRLSARGRKFKGIVVKKFPRRLTIEIERRVYYSKYERYATLKTKLHAHLPSCLENQIEVGDIVRIQECRPLSKIIHFVVLEKIKSGEKK